MSYYDEVTADSPVCYWRLDDTNTTCVDSGSAGINGTYTGTYTQSQNSLVYGDGNAATYFNGSTGYVDLGTNQIAPVLSGASGFTMECLVKYSAIPSNSANILSLVGHNTNPFIDLMVIIGGAVRARICNGSTGTQLALATSANGVIAANKTYHIVVVYDCSPNPNTLKVYVNGTPVASANDASGATGLTVGTPTTDDRIASYYTGGTTFSNAVIDEVALYTSALSEERISAHYLASACLDLTFLKPTRRPLMSVQKPINHIGI
jgi:hypothetical protein